MFKNDLSNLEDCYIKQSNSLWRKQLGQVFTPPTIAQFMMRWITDKVKNGRILDPALGLGVFFHKMATNSSTTSPYQCVGYEIDPSITEFLDEIITEWNFPLTYHLKDFLLTEITEEFDGIICNPPYIHFQDYNHSLTLIQEFNQRYGLELNGFSNIYALFLIKALHLLKPGGRAAFIIPSEFLNADYGVSIKKFLLSTGTLQKIIIFDSNIQLFPGILTTSAILLFEKSNNEHAKDHFAAKVTPAQIITNNSSSLDIFTVSQLSDLEKIERYLYTNEKTPNLKVNSYSYTQLNPLVKWKQYYNNLKIHSQIDKKSHLIPFQQFANIRRGIATGANTFFTLSLKDLQRYQIKQEYVSPCLSRASLAQYAIFSEQEFQELIESDKKVFLLNIRGKNLDENIWNYIRLGEKNHFHTGYLTRNRQPWYTMETIQPADLLVKTFGRNRAFFIENQSQALHLTCFHGIYLNTIGHQYRKAIFLYLLTDLAKEIFEGQKREYGSGLGKFEPNDIKYTKVLDFTLLKTEDIKLLNNLYLEYNHSYRLFPQKLITIIKQVEDIYLQYW